MVWLLPWSWSDWPGMLQNPAVMPRRNAKQKKSEQVMSRAVLFLIKCRQYVAIDSAIDVWISTCTCIIAQYQE